MAKVNHRATYLRYLLPLAHPRYALTMPDKPLTSMQRVLYGIYLNGMPYNDFMLRRFCEIMLRNTDKARLFAEPLPEDYKDLQKLTWTFINSFKKSANARYSYEQDIM
ncbi:hypothetical protein [Cohnella panacarvi]|uniref:hypothetical protein n=1 Tax=Cohnella panacarvi TaxID=400776 RepID=UPI0012EC8B39|nr:hypothetical protein [Cohnella panacarvi]